MPKLVYDKSLLPINNHRRVSIRAWEAKNNTVNYQFRISSKIIKSRSCVWRNTDRLTGRNLKKKLEDFATKFQRDFEIDEENAKRGAVSVIPHNISFADYYNHFLDVKRARNTKLSTIRCYENVGKRCIDRFGKIQLCDITADMLNTFYCDLKGMPKENGKKARCRVDLKAIMKPFYITQTEIYTLAGISDKTVASCISGHIIEFSKAKKIYDAFITLLNDNEKLKKTNGIRSRKRKPEPPITKIPQYKFNDIFDTISNNDTLSDKTIWEHHQLICVMLGMAVKEGVISYNPALNADKPKYSTPEQDVFSVDEIKNILSIINDEYSNGKISAKWRAIMYLLIFTGCRRGEISGLKWDSIDFDNRIIDINNTWLYTAGSGSYNSTPKTKSSKRKLTITDDLFTALLDYQVEYNTSKPNDPTWNEEGYVFTQASGKPINTCTITDYCAKFSDRYGLRHIHPHSFRHSVATNLIHQQVDVVSVSHLLGHSKPSVTMDIYAHAFRDSNSTTCKMVNDLYSIKKDA